MNTQEAAWLAGIVDGEGCITITVQRAGTGGRVNNSYRLYLKVTMCHEPTIRRIHQMTGLGTVTTNIPKNPNWRQAWSWWTASRQAIQVLEQIGPMMFTKAHEKDLALEWGQLALAPRGGKGGGREVPKDLLDERHRLYLALKEAKK